MLKIYLIGGCYNGQLSWWDVKAGHMPQVKENNIMKTSDGSDHGDICRAEI
jgi:hypothetical protein